MKKILCILFSVLLVLALTGAAVAEDHFSFDEKKYTLFEGQSLAPAILREGRYAEGTLTFSSGDKRVITVDEYGVISAVGKGSTTVSCVWKNGSSSKKCTANVNVLRAVTDVDLKTGSMKLFDAGDPTVMELITPTENPVLMLCLGRQYTLETVASPSGASDRKVLLEISDPSVLTLQSKGTILKADALGESDLRLYSQQNPEISRTYRVLVVKPVSSLTLSAESKTLNVGSCLNLDISYQPDSATVKEAVWSSDKPEVAEVDESGTVTGLKRGYVNIKAVAADGSGRSATLTLNVVQPPESITLKSYEGTVAVGSTLRIAPTVLPESAANRSVIYTSDDPSVATVSKDGTVKGVSAGTCTVVCACAGDPGITACYAVTVTQPVTKIAFNDKSITVDAKSSAAAAWTVYPDNATDPSVTFKSSNEKIATVNENGLITGIKKGNCKITVTAADGSRRSATISVKVTQPVEGLYFRQDIYHVPYKGKLTLHVQTDPKDADIQSMSWNVSDDYVISLSSAHTKNNAVTLSGRHLGSTPLYATSDDGGYTAMATALVDHYNAPVQVADLDCGGYDFDVAFHNVSNMNLTRVYFTLAFYDRYGQAIYCNTSDHSNVVSGYYQYDLEPGCTTDPRGFRYDHLGSFDRKLGGLILTVTGFKSDSTYTIDGVTKNYGLTLKDPYETRYPRNLQPVEPDL